jgi:hypothetical protein
MGFDDQLWSYLVHDHGADQIQRPVGSRTASELGRGPRRRRPRARWLVIPGLAAAVVVVVTVVLTSTHDSHVAWSRTVIRRAAAFVAPPADAREIVHVQATITRTPLERRYEALDRDVASVTENAWFLGGQTLAARAILHPAGGDTYVVDNNLGFYDATRRLELRTPAAPSSKPLHYRVMTGRRAIRAQLSGGRRVTLRVSPSELGALRTGKDLIQEILEWNGLAISHSALITPRRVTVERTPTPPPDPTSTGFAAALRVLLDSGTAQVIRTTVQNGRPALQIYAAHPKGSPPVTYYVDPTTYAPIELDIHNSLSRLANTVIRFHAYQRLPLAGHRDLLRFTLPHDTRTTRAATAFYYAANLPTLEDSAF